MLSEEEKKAIELLKKLQKKTPYIIWGDGTPYNKSNQIQTILNLIENQQKEINDFENIKKEHQIMKRIILENGLWETLLNDDEFTKHLNEEK